MINDNLPAFHRAIKAFSEEYRPKVSALFLHRKMDGRIRDNVKLYDSITSGDGIEFATKSATNRDGLREFSVMGNFLEKVSMWQGGNVGPQQWLTSWPGGTCIYATKFTTARLHQLNSSGNITT